MLKRKVLKDFHIFRYNKGVAEKLFFCGLAACKKGVTACISTWNKSHFFH